MTVIDKNAWRLGRLNGHWNTACNSMHNDR